MKTQTFVALALALFPVSTAAERLSVDEVRLDRTQVPLAELSCISVDPGTSLTLQAPGDPVLSVGIAPPIFENPSDGAIYGVDYFVDLTDGVATVSFHGTYPFYVETRHASGLILAGHVFVGASPMSDEDTRRGFAGAATPWNPIPDGDVVIHAPDVETETCWIPSWVPKKKEGNGQGGLIGEICKASEAAGGPVDVVTVSHGWVASIDPGGWNINKSNVCDFGTKIKKKVMGKCLTIVACYVGSGDCGKQFVCDLAKKTCAKVTAARGCVTVTSDGGLYYDEAGLITKDGREDTPDDGDGDGDGDPTTEESNRGGDSVAQSARRLGREVYLPLDVFSNETAPHQRLMGDFGVYSAAWDLNRDRMVDQVDLVLLSATLERSN